MTVTYRMGVPDDAYHIAEFLHLASGGLSDFLLTDILPNCEIMDLIALGVTDKSATISYTKTMVAEKAGSIVGVLNYYPVSEHKIPDIMLSFVPQDRIDHLQPFFSTIVEDSMYLHALAVKESPGQRSIGKVLILKVCEQAKKLGINKISAHVWATNHRVIHTLLRAGFQVFAKINFPEHALLPNQNQMLLLSYEIR